MTADVCEHQGDFFSEFSKLYIVLIKFCLNGYIVYHEKEENIDLKFHIRIKLS